MIYGKHPRERQWHRIKPAADWNAGQKAFFNPAEDAVTFCGKVLVRIPVGAAFTDDDIALIEALPPEGAKLCGNCFRGPR